MKRLAWIALLLAAGCTQEAPKPNEKMQMEPMASSGPVRVRFETTKGDFVVEVRPDWAPRGVDRFLELVRTGFFDGCRFYRVVPGWVVQWGIHGDPAVNQSWSYRTLKDDPGKASNVRGTVTFAAAAAPHTRSTQVFINYKDHPQLDSRNFPPIGKVVEGMDVVDSLNSKYGEKPSDHQSEIMNLGNEWLDENFPGLDSIESAKIVGGGSR